jgi:hypothetical protein
MDADVLIDFLKENVAFVEYMERVLTIDVKGYIRVYNKKTGKTLYVGVYMDSAVDALKKGQTKWTQPLN